VGTTFIYVTHDQGEAMSLSDRITIMNQGNMEQIGTPQRIYETPSTSFVASFIGDTNFIRDGNECVAWARSGFAGWKPACWARSRRAVRCR